MKTVIYYFSGTGNSLNIAKDIAKDLNNAKIISIPSVKDVPNLNYDAIGIVFPVYFGGLPLNVREFLKKVKTKKYVFAVANFGAISGAALSQARDILKKNKTKLNAGFLIQMPDSYLEMFSSPSKEDMKKIFSLEEKKVLLISGMVNNREDIPIEKFNPLFDFFITPYYKSRSKKIPFADKNFWVMDKCNGCKMCERICQFDNIKMKDNKPSWKNHCEQCFACIQFCPKEAIQIANNTMNKKRYHNPHVKASDICKKIIKK